MKVLIFGRGFVGTKMQAALEDSVLDPADIADVAQVRRAMEEHTPDAVLNCAGKTGTPNIDWCETNQFVTYRSNTLGPLVLAEECAARKIHLVHLGTGCVFYGASPDPQGWLEEDFANPSGVYYRSKYAADLLLAKLPDVAIVRLRMPIDSEPSPKNLIDKLSHYSKVLEAENSVTVIDDLITATKAILAQRATGIFHAVNPGVMRNRRLIELYTELVDPTHANEWITNEQILAQGLVKSARPNCLLQDTRLPAIGIHLRPIEEALRDCMEKYAAAVRTAHKI